MANYPGANPSFTTKQDGVDYPQAAHINTIQDEVVAIGTALRSGLDHALTVNTGGVTVSAGGLRVTGASTLATVQAGNSTIAGDLVVSGTLTVGGTAITGGRLDGAKVTNTAFQEIANSAWVGLSWNNEVHDTNNLHSTSANSSRLLLNSSGLWMIGAQVTWISPSSGGEFQGRIVLSDTSILTGFASQPMVNNGVSSKAAYTFSAPHYATDTGQYVTVQVYQNSGSTRSVAGSTAVETTSLTNIGPTQFWVQKVSA